MAQSINDIVAAALAKKTPTNSESTAAREITSHAGSSIKTKSASGLSA